MTEANMLNLKDVEKKHMPKKAKQYENKTKQY